MTHLDLSNEMRYPLLRYLGWLGGWIVRRGMHKKHYGSAA